MIKDALAVIGFLWLGTTASQIIRWYFRANRDGNSGRHKHWSEE